MLHHHVCAHFVNKMGDHLVVMNWVIEGANSSSLLTLSQTKHSLLSGKWTHTVNKML